MSFLFRILVAILWVCGAFGAVFADDDVRKLSTEPRRSSAVGPPYAPARLDFEFGEIRAWLLADGNWNIEGIVRHRGALCADYQLGIQFGIGSPGCANVEWIGRPQYVTYHKQCNNAVVRHIGGDLDLSAAQNFERINCGQRLIRCSGKCR